MAIAIIGTRPARPSRPESIKAAILRAMSTGLCWSSDRWRHLPGTLPWWELRIRIGGRVSAVAFAQAIEDLLADGKLIEVWLARTDGRDAPHLLVLPGKSSALKRPVAQARGKPEVMAAEPWYAALGGVQSQGEAKPGQGGRNQGEPGSLGRVSVHLRAASFPWAASQTSRRSQPPAPELGRAEPAEPPALPGCLEPLPALLVLTDRRPGLSARGAFVGLPPGPVSLGHRRYLAALRTLAVVRKLAVPTVQVNVGGNQVNVAGAGALPDDSGGRNLPPPAP